MEDKIFSKNYIDRICIDSDVVEAYKEKDNVRVIFINTIELDDGTRVEDGGDYVSIYLPLPLRFDEKWFNKYKEINLTEDTSECCDSEGYIKKLT